MNSTWLLGAILINMWQGVVAGTALIARLYPEPSTAPLMWLVTGLTLLTGGAYDGHRKRYRYR